MKIYHSSSALGEFMRSRRQRLRPEDSGIEPLPGRRRTPGLRREEVAYLANMSVTYYTWLEQGKELHPSNEILLNISRALQLNESEHKYLFALAEPDPVESPAPRENQRTDRNILQRWVDQMRYPSFITDEGTDVLAWNRAAQVIIADFGALPEGERYMLNTTFLDGGYRERLVNWEEFARYSAAWVRTHIEQVRLNPLHHQRFEHLRSESELFRHYWDMYEVQQKQVMRAIYRVLDHQILEFNIHSAGMIDNDPGLHWCIFVPVDEQAELLLDEVLARGN
ncbi:DNA-binding protein [Saccharibacillus sp. O16]|nr:DNA-binding protein [Saccharibacillus sp. O16]